jgi:hypothetical protein
LKGIFVSPLRSGDEYVVQDGCREASRHQEDVVMTKLIRFLMFLEAAAFIAAALIHAGLLFSGYEHREARIAESVIAVVLLAGLAFTWIRPRWTIAAGLAAQGFALLGTAVGIFMIAIGVGPRTLPDIVYHVAIVIVLVFGLAVIVRAPSRASLRA